MSDTLMINEIFFSIQGEGTRAGLPCVFIRLTGCHLRCHYCDTEYAFHEGERHTIDEVLAEVQEVGDHCELVEITGGEPLLQPAVFELMSRLCDAGRTVMVETSGACDITACDHRVVRIVDIKTPGSGEVERNLWSNIEHLGLGDEVKFVLCSRSDYEWAREMVQCYELDRRVAAVLFSAVMQIAPGNELPGAKGLAQSDLAEWILADHLPVRFQPQLHKWIWGPTMRGV